MLTEGDSVGAYLGEGCYPLLNPPPPAGEEENPFGPRLRRDFRRDVSRLLTPFDPDL